ncbi:MAG TPA: glycosyltransferase family 2 protein [Chitinophagales bacterium]|nr:glycosyltransferase family 2 protein [Chitinophagales bacterium]
MQKVSIVIPVYNESESIADTIHEIKEIFDGQLLYLPEIIVVNDGSVDDTIHQVSSTHPEVMIVNNVLNMGYGYSLKRGIEHATNDTIIILDGDGSYPVHQLNKMLDRYFQGLDLVVGARNDFFVEDSFFKSMFRWLLKLIVEFTAGTKIPDVNSGMRIFSKSTIMPYFPYLSNKFSFTTSMTLHFALDSMKVEFIPNGYRKRKGQSKVSIYKDSIRTLQFIIEIIAIKNPLKLHLMVMTPSFILLLFSIVYWIKGFGIIPFALLTSTLLIQLSIAALGLNKMR